MNGQSKSDAIEENNRGSCEDGVVVVLQRSFGGEDVEVHDHEVAKVRREGESSKDDDRFAGQDFVGHSIRTDVRLIQKGTRHGEGEDDTTC